MLIDPSLCLLRQRGGTYRSMTWLGSSSTPGFSKSSKVAEAFSFHSSSSLLIWGMLIWRARSCSCSDGTLTSHGKKQRSSIRGSHCDVSHVMSLLVGIDAHGCLHSTATGDLVPLDNRAHTRALPAQNHHDRVALGWDEPKQKHISVATVVALQHRLAK